MHKSGNMPTGEAVLIGVSLGILALAIGIICLFDLRITRPMLHPGKTRAEFYADNPAARLPTLVVGSLFLFAGGIVILAMATVVLSLIF